MAASIGLSSEEVYRSDIPTIQLFSFNCSLSLFVVLFHFVPIVFGYKTHLISSPMWTLKLFSILFGMVQLLYYRLLSKTIYHQMKTFKITRRSDWQNFCKKLKYTMKYIFIYGVSVIGFHIIAVLYGAAAVESVEETFMLSVVLATLTVLPCLGILHLNGEEWFHLFLSNRPLSESETCLWQTTVATLAGAWFGAFPVPLDWDRPWQEWPISCVIGATVGYCTLLFLSSVYLLCNRSEMRRGRKTKQI
ncbi:GPI ethanolamine phosphate transferase, stabilizing subunit-like [Glandiceps talaboti]